MKKAAKAIEGGRGSPAPRSLTAFLLRKSDFNPWRSGKSEATSAEGWETRPVPTEDG